MIQLVTLDEAKMHLRITDDDQDADVTFRVMAASSAVLNYLNGARNLYVPEIDSNGDFVTDDDGYYVALEDSDGKQIRQEVKAATLILLADMYANREGAAGTVAAAYLMAMPMPAQALLYPLRDPVIR